MGLMTVSGFGIITLLENADDDQRSEVSNLIKNWQNQEKKDPIHYLQDFPEYLKCMV